jgi:hypothetical protein
MSEQGFRGVPGLPDGFELVEFRHAFIGDFVFDIDGFVHRLSRDADRVLPIVRKIEKQKRYRPFANAEEFRPHRDRWWKWKTKPDWCYPPTNYSDKFHSANGWEDSFNRKVFEDGSPFGVEVTE